MRHDDDSEDRSARKSTRRIVVQDSARRPPARAVQGRKLSEPPKTGAARLPVRVDSKIKLPQVRKLYLWLGLGAGMVLLLLVVGLLVKPPATPRESTTTGPTPPAETPRNSTVSNLPAAAPAQSGQSGQSDRIEEDARQVLRQISRDNKSYSFSEHAVADIRSRVIDHRQISSLARTLATLQQNSGAISAKAAKEGLQPSLVLLVALALTKGGQSSDCLAAAARAVPLLGLLNKTFGSNEADSSLILIAAYLEGAGTRRSHPLLRRMNRVVTNPLAERNVWFLHDRNVLSEGAYDLVVDTIAYGVIARNPRQFGLDSDPLSL